MRQVDGVADGDGWEVMCWGNVEGKGEEGEVVLMVGEKHWTQKAMEGEWIEVGLVWM